MASLWFRRKEIWWPTWRALVGLTVIVAVAASWFVFSVHGWLSPSAPINDARFSIIEGWAPDPVPWAAKQWSEQHDTQCIYVTGIPMERGMMVTGQISFADITARTLQRMGVSPAKIKTASANTVNVERTRAMARALSEVLIAQNISPADRRINLFTSGTHARRSWIHFQRELGPSWEVGVISIPNSTYPANRWWRYSEGVKSVLDELIGIVVQSIGGS